MARLSIFSDSTERRCSPRDLELCNHQTTVLVSFSSDASPSGAPKSSGRHCRSLLHPLDDGWVPRGRFGIEQGSEEPGSQLLDISVVPLQNTFHVLDTMLRPRLPPTKAHRPLQLIVQAPIVAILVDDLGSHRVPLQTGMDSSPIIAVRIPLLASLSVFDVAGTRLFFIGRCVSRCWTQEVHLPLLVNPHLCTSPVRTVCAASRIASRNSVLADMYALQGCARTCPSRATVLSII